MNFVGNLLLFTAVKEFCKSMKKWQSYSHGYGGTLFLTHTVHSHCINGHCHFPTNLGPGQSYNVSALTLLVGRQEGYPAVKTEWWGTGRSKVQVICMWSSWCHCHPIISCSSKIQNGLPWRCWLTQVVLEKRPLNRCSSSIQVNCVSQHS